MPMQTVDSMSYLKTIPRSTGEAFKDSEYASPLQVFSPNKSGLFEPLAWIIAVALWVGLLSSPYLWRWIAGMFK